MDIFEEISDTLAVTSFDPNDTRDAATLLDSGQYEIAGNGVDWYRFDVDAGGMSFTMDQDNEARDLFMALFNENGQLLTSDRQTRATENIEFLARQEGTYYLRVVTAQFVANPPDDLTMTYTLDVGLPDASVSDGNDTRDTARALEAGRYSIEGSAQDWFRISSLSGDIHIDLEAQAGLLTENLNVVLQNARGLTVASSQGPTGSETITYTAPTPGDYFIKVFWAGAPDATSGGIKLDYTLDITLPEADVSEANDTIAGATALTEGTSAQQGSNVDWYKIDSLSGAVNLALRAGPDVPGKIEDLNMVLYAADGTTVFESSLTPGTGVENITHVLPTDGEYFIKVFANGFPDGAPNGSRLSYTLEVDLPEAQVRGPNDPGETRATATLLNDGTRNVVGTGTDWFRIDTGPGELNFHKRSTGGGDISSVEELNMVLYDASGQEVAAGGVTGGDESISWYASQTATYFLKVFAPAYPDETPNGVEMRYTLTTDLPQKTFSIPLEFGPVRGSSVAAYDIDNDGRDELFVGTSKTLDADGNEIRPAGLIVFEDDGTVKWTKTFAAIDGIDPSTGKRYETTSVSTQAVFTDVDDDGDIDILIGVGADNAEEDFLTPGQPGDKGGLYALDRDGNELWYHETRDTFGAGLNADDSIVTAEDKLDGRPEGVYGTPRVFDIDADGKREVLFTSWDQTLYILDAATGQLEREFDLHDTTSTTPGVADINGDGLYEIIVASDITDNPRAGIPQQGGLLSVLSSWAQPNVDGWTDQIFTSTSADFRGKFVNQPLWSNPEIADIDRDGQLEIIHGTSNFFADTRGQFIKIWNADGTPQATLLTKGQPLAAPLLADLDGNGRLEIIATTVKGYVHAWNADGSEIFTTQVRPYSNPPLTGTAAELPIVRQAVAVDVDNADGDLELIVTIGSQNVILDSDGTQLSSLERAERVFSNHAGSPLVKDIDGDGRLDFISGGTTEDRDRGVLFRWENPYNVVSDDYRTAEYQNSQSLNQIQDFVERFYDTILGRSADPRGLNGWTDDLVSGVLSGENIARGFIKSAEFQSRGTTDQEYVQTLYAAFFGRAADAGGLNGWLTQLSNGVDRDAVLDGFTGSREFKVLSESFGIRPELTIAPGETTALIRGDAGDTSLLRGGAGSQTIIDELGPVTDPGNRADIIESGQVFRIYGATLGRIPDPGGWLGWVNALADDPNMTIERVANGFVGSTEFQNTYGSLSDAEFVNLLYQNVLGRDADAGGLQNWLNQLSNGATRAQVVLGFSNSGEYVAATNAGLDGFMREIKVEWNDVIEGGAGNDQMNAGLGSDLFVFRKGEGGNDTVHGFEPWDQLQLSGFGYDTGADAIARMTQSGGNVVFVDQGQRIEFVGTRLAEMQRVRFNV